jgi:hypothetical protein
MGLYETAKNIARRARDFAFPGKLEFYHSYEKFGLSLPQRSGIYPLNQQAKEPILTRYLQHAIDACGDRPVTVAELFCADAYYSFLARKMGANHCDAFDNDRDGHFREARHVMKLLDEKEITLHKQSVFEVNPDYRADIVMNTGGLYHVSDPVSALHISAQMAKRFLIVQTVVSLANEASDYFETPCPGWTWGCRFSHAWLEREVSKLGFKVLASERNTLEGNDRPEDRGSSYFLLERPVH